MNNVEEQVEEILKPIDKVSQFIFQDVKTLTKKPSNKTLRTPEDSKERMELAQAKRDRKNARRLNSV